jgi:hypothetical protein
MFSKGKQFNVIAAVRGVVLLGLIGVLAACGTAATPSPTEQPSATPPLATTTPPPTQTPQPVIPPAAESVAAMLAQQLGVSTTDVKVLEATPKEWSDSCLGAGRISESCAAVITPGYLIRLAVQAAEYVYHTDRDAYQVRLVSAPEMKLGDPKIEWRGDVGLEQTPCMQMVTTGIALAFADCDAPYQLGRFLVDSHPARLTEFLATFAAFEADTPAGRLVFKGSGARTAEALDQRMIAEWMKLITLEARLGRTAPASFPQILAWLSKDEMTGVCRSVFVHNTGQAYAVDCQPVTPVTREVPLTRDQLEQIYNWVDSLEPYSGPVENNKQIQLVGRGQTAASAADLSQINELAQQVWNAVWGQSDQPTLEQELVLFKGHIKMWLTERDDASLYELMGEQVTLAYWRSEGISASREDAREQLRAMWKAGAPIVIYGKAPINFDLSNYGGYQVLDGVWAGGFGDTGKGEAAFVIARDAQNALRIVGIFYAFEGFAQ